jgi:polyisoprenoid-binding protein YceI
MFKTELYSPGIGLVKLVEIGSCGGPFHYVSLTTSLPISSITAGKLNPRRGRLGLPRHSGCWTKKRQKMLTLRAGVVLVLLFSGTTARQSDSAGQYPIDTNHSTIGFSVSILNGLSKVTGKFTDFTVTLKKDEHDISKSSVSVVIQAKSINTGIAERDNHLRTADFFDVEKYPEITFRSTRIEKTGNQLIAIGTLTMHGVSKEIALPFTVSSIEKDPVTKKITTGYATRLTLNRRDFGVHWQKSVPNFVSDNVEIEINLIARALVIR